MTWTCARTRDAEDATTDEAHVHPGYELHTISPDCFCAPKRIDEVEGLLPMDGPLSNAVPTPILCEECDPDEVIIGYESEDSDG